MEFIVGLIVNAAAVAVTGVGVWLMAAKEKRDADQSVERRLSSLEAKFSNGVGETLKRLEGHVGRIFGLLDGLNCDRHDVQLDHLEKTVDKLQSVQQGRRSESD